MNLKRNKVISLFIAFSLIIMSNQITFAMTPDVKGSQYEEAAETLIGLNIMSVYNDGTFRAEDYITRAEFLFIMGKAIGIESLNSVFSPNDDTQKLSIDYFRNQDIISGYSDGSLGESDAVTYAQAVKVIVSVLGYKLHAEAKGGYPLGYMYLADELDIISGISADVNKKINRGDIALMLFNALDVNIMKQSVLGSEIKYEAVKGKTFLTENPKINKIKGVVAANGDTTLTGKSKISDDEVLIGNIVYKIGKTDINYYLGYSVVLYENENTMNSDKTILYFRPDIGKNNVITISADNLDINSSKFNYDKIVYTNNNGDEETASISVDADLIYNGVAYSGFDADTFKISQGSIKLIDNNDDDVYEIVNISEYDNYVIKSIDLDSKTIYDMYGKSICLDDKNTVIKNSNGNVLEFRDLQNLNVLSVMKSIDENKIMVICSTAIIKGEVEEVSSDKDITVTINNVKYKISKSYENSLSYDAKTINVKDSGIFYLDYNNEIAAVKLVASLNNPENAAYGYCVKAEEKSTVGDTAEIRIFTSKGKFTNYTFDDNPYYNGLSKDSNGNRYTGISIIEESAFKNDDGTFKQQLVKYVVDGDDKITKIYTAVDTPNPIDYNKDVFSLNATVNGALYRLVSQIFSTQVSSQYKINQNTVIFGIPNPDANGNINEEDYTIVPISSLVNDKTYNVKVFDANELNLVKAVTTAPIYNDVNNYFNVFIVDKITKTINSDGETIDKLYGFSSGKSVSYPIKEGINITAYKGDMLRIIKNHKNEIISYTPLFSLKSTPFPYKKVLIGPNIDGEYVNLYGSVYSKDLNIFTLTLDNGNNIMPCVIQNATRIYIIDTAKMEDDNFLTICPDIDAIVAMSKNKSANDLLEDGSRVFVNLRWDYVLDVVIIK